MMHIESFLRLLVLSMGLLALAGPVFSQETGPTTDSSAAAAIAIFVDGPYSGSDYFRTEITMADFVRDRNQADIHILTTSQTTGGGGRKYTVEFIGRSRFAGMYDTLFHYSRESDTEDMVRRGLTRTINLGLVRYVARTDLAEYVSVSVARPARSEAVVDKWNRWVFEIGTHAWANGQKSERSARIGGDIEARRVTEALRIELEMYANYQESRYRHIEGATLDISSSKGAEAMVAFALDDHWSAGAWSFLEASTYSNVRAKVGLFPALEYNYFPYSESTRRQLTFTYLVGVAYADYKKETLYDQHHEWLCQEELWITLAMIEPWGKANVGLSGSHYFHDFSRYRLQLSGGLAIRLIEGLSLDISGRTSRIHDQLNLPKGSLSKEDVLLRRTELATDYNYSVSFGISYSFGSIYSDAVNPRFGY
jgi:hypothetical protein